MLHIHINPKVDKLHYKTPLILPKNPAKHYVITDINVILIVRLKNREKNYTEKNVGRLSRHEKEKFKKK